MQDLLCQLVTVFYKETSPARSFPPLFLWGNFQITTELTAKTFLLMFILHLPIYFDTVTPTNQPSYHWGCFLCVSCKTKASLTFPIKKKIKITHGTGDVNAPFQTLCHCINSWYTCKLNITCKPHCPFHKNHILYFKYLQRQSQWMTQWKRMSECMEQLL